MLERTKVRLNKQEWDKLKAQNPELAKLDVEEILEKPAKEVGVEIPLLLEDDVWQKRTHDIPNWALTLLIALSLVGTGFIAYEIYLHWVWAIIITVFTGAIIWAIILRRRDNE